MSSFQIPKTMRAVLIRKTGGPEAIETQDDYPVPTLAEDQVLIKISYAGVNFIDTYKRSGLYQSKYPLILGEEGAGTIVDIHPSVNSSDIKLGRRVAFISTGSYAEYIAISHKKLAYLPDHVSFKDAAGVLLQGLTALTMLQESYAVKSGDWILVHAAAGGVGLNLCQIASYLGVNVIGTTSTLDKAELARKNGAETVVVNGSAEDLKAEVDKNTDGKGVHAVFDGVGKATWEGNFPLLSRKGTIVSFGNASGPPPEISPLILGKGNWKLTRPVLNNAIHTPEEFEYYTSELFKLVDQKVVNLLVNGTYPLSAEGLRQAHADLTGRKTVGKLVIQVADE
ncbi:quinone oxidoreductase [Phaffia rhodozyma]|uniref:Probable quinone oxidoreductase n=1 Tax=Phaffia rhodozyma TaxID=264483 RepID=A0A0F7SNX5_PHARH|nr:quinone oxidoreductase [Phaffia rhodozyma]